MFLLLLWQFKTPECQVPVTNTGRVNGASIDLIIIIIIIIISINIIVVSSLHGLIKIGPHWVHESGARRYYAVGLSNVRFFLRLIVVCERNQRIHSGQGFTDALVCE